MTKALAEITRASGELSTREKYQLAGFLLESVDAPSEPAAEIEAAWEGEIQRRIGEIRTGKVKGVPLSEVKRKMEKRFGR